MITTEITHSIVDENPEPCMENLKDQADNINIAISLEFPSSNHKEQLVIGITQYLVECNTINGYKLLNENKLIIFLLMHGLNWRAHNGNLYQYSK